MVKAADAIQTARALIGTPYSELDCINLIKRVIRTAPGGVTSYTTAGTNSLWRSYDMSAKYRDLTWRQEGIQGARAGMLAFKRNGEDVHHVGIVAERPQCGMQRGGDRESQGAEGDYASSPGGCRMTVIHSSSAKGEVVETALDDSWQLLAIHRYIGTDFIGETGDDMTMNALYQAVVSTQSGALNVRDAPDGGRIGSLPKGKTVDVLAEPAQGWTFVRYGSLMGYVSSAYLTRAESEEGENVISVSPEVTIIDDEGNSFRPVGGWRVLIGGVD